MRKEFVMRGQTKSTLGLNTDILNFSGFKPGIAYKLVDLQIYHSTNIGQSSYEMCISITAGKTAVDPESPNFNDEWLIATGLIRANSADAYPHTSAYVINDTFLITQNLILQVRDTAGSNYPVNWQCKFEAVKMSGSEEEVTNYKQFAISDE